MSRCRILATLGLLPFGLVRSAEVPTLERLEEDFAESGAVVPRNSVVFEGIVFEPDGVPARGAVLLTSAGGKAITDRSGKYRIEVGLSAETRSVQLTATGGGNTGLVASRNVILPAGSTLVQVQPLELAQESVRLPSWLPTFGAEPGMNNEVRALAVFDDGSGPALYVGGEFTAAAGLMASNIAKWDGSRWSAVGSGLSGGGVLQGFVGVRALTVFDDGSGPTLFVAGSLSPTDSYSPNIAKWDGSSWSPPGFGLSEWVRAVAAFDDGSGEALYAGGPFSIAGLPLGTTAQQVAKWDGSGWTPIGGMISRVNVLTVFDDGSGPALYAGGDFPGVDGQVARRIARWDGSSWTGLDSNMNGEVNALAKFDIGAGPMLCVAGRFTIAGNGTANRIASWNGSSWAALGSGMNQAVHAAAEFDDGSGPALYAAGEFTTAGGVAANRIARWDGSSWTALGSGMNEVVRALAVFDDGDGAALYAGGEFWIAGAAVTSCIAEWDGSSWKPLGFGVAGSAVNKISSLAVFDDGTGQRSTPGDNSRRPAAWRRTTSPGGTARTGRRSAAAWTRPRSSSLSWTCARSRCSTIAPDRLSTLPATSRSPGTPETATSPSGAPRTRRRPWSSALLPS